MKQHVIFFIKDVLAFLLWISLWSLSTIAFENITGFFYYFLALFYAPITLSLFYIIITPRYFNVWDGIVASLFFLGEWAYFAYLGYWASFGDGLAFTIGFIITLFSTSRRLMSLSRTVQKFQSESKLASSIDSQPEQRIPLYKGFLTNITEEFCNIVFIPDDFMISKMGKEDSAIQQLSEYKIVYNNETHELENALPGTAYRLKFELNSHYAFLDFDFNKNDEIIRFEFMGLTDSFIVHYGTRKKLAKKLRGLYFTYVNGIINALNRAYNVYVKPSQTIKKLYFTEEYEYVNNYFSLCGQPIKEPLDAVILNVNIK